MFHVFKIPAMKAIKVIECRDVDYETAKKEVIGYFQRKAKRTPPRSSTDLATDYELICKIMDDLELEGKMEPSMEGYEIGDSIHGHRIIAEARKVSDAVVNGQ